MAATKSRLVLQTSASQMLKRVVSTSTTNTQNIAAASIALERAKTCPIRNALQTVDGILRREDLQDMQQTPAQTHAQTHADIHAQTHAQTHTEIKSFDEIPGPKGLPIVGTLFDYFKKDGLRFSKMYEAYQKRGIEFGPIYKEKIATIHSVVISDPVEYSKVIRSESKYPIRREMEPMAYYRRQTGIDLGLVNDQGENWHKLRTVTAPKMLKMKCALDFCTPMNDVANDFVEHLNDCKLDNQEIHGLEKELFKWAFESIGTFLFEERIGCFANPMPEKAQDFIEHLQEYFKYLQPLMFNVPTYKLYKTKLWKKFEYHADKVFELGKYFIEKKVAEIEAKSSDASVTAEDNEKVAFLTYMLSQKSLTTEEALSTAVDLLQAATETTSNAMLWTLYCLAENPRVQEKMLEETKAVLGEDGQINEHNISKLTYVKAVLKESFRMYPITWATSRITQDEIEVAGYKIPSGTHIQANLYGMYRDEKIFPNNNTFQPERWLRENQMDTHAKSLSNLVWGHGARMCIGRRFAEQEIYILLTKIIQNFRLEYHHEPIEATLNTVMTPDRPVKLTFVSRKH